MTQTLLSSRITIPRLQPNLVPRPQLIEKLDEGLKLGRKMSLISAPAGFGKSTLAAAPTLSHRELMNLIFDEAGHPAKVRGSRISSYFVRGIGLFQADVAEVVEMLYQFEKPLVVEHSKFEREFGANPTAHNEAVRKTLAWYRQNPI